jgi:hypothetical protein
MDRWIKVDRAFDFLKEKESKQTSFTIEELCNYSQLKEATVRTYLSKRWFKHIGRGSGKEYTCHGIVSLSKNDFHALHSQKLHLNESPLLLTKAREFALIGVGNYNDPKIKFKTYSYIVNIIIAWTSLLHAIFEKQGIDYFYKSEKTKGEKLAWDLSKCITEYWRGNNNPIRDNLRFLIGLRNEIEHRYLPVLDIMVEDRCQSCLTNFENLLVDTFGEQHSLNLNLAISLQLSSVSTQARDRALKEFQKNNYKAIRDYIYNFDSNLDESIRTSQNYRLRMFLIPNINNHEKSADLCLEYINLDPDNQEHKDKLTQIIAIKQKNSPKYYLRPKQVSDKVSRNINKRFDPYLHTKAYKFYKVRCLQKNPKHQNNSFCGWMNGYDNYLYSDAWVDYLTEKLSYESEYNKLLSAKV